VSQHAQKPTQKCIKYPNPGNTGVLIGEFPFRAIEKAMAAKKAASFLRRPLLKIYYWRSANLP
jgi:hypothetical protein